MSGTPTPDNNEEPFERNADLGNIRLNETQLDQLIRRAEKDLTNSRVRVKTLHNGTPLSADTLSELIDLAEQQDGEITRFANLAIEVRSQQATVEIRFGGHLASIKVTSHSEDLANGRTKALRDFLWQRGARDWRPGLQQAIAGGAGAVCTTTMIVYAWLFVAGHGAHAVTLTASGTLVLVALTLIAARQRTRRKIELTRGTASPTGRRGPSWVADAATIAASGAGLVAALLDVLT